MSVMHAHPGLEVICQTCGATGIGHEFITRGWDGETYGFACGHEHHLDPRKGGALTRLVQPSSEAEGRRREEKAPSASP